VDLVSGFVVGILGSLHCAGMCGPIALALPPGVSRNVYFIGGRLLYNLGRIVTYVMLGAIVGSLGGVVAIAGMQQMLSISIGCVLLAAVFLPTLARSLSPGSGVVQSLQIWFRQRLGTLLDRRTISSLFLIGVMNGFLPCGFLYVALAGAATLGGTIHGAVFLAGFGGGTLPLMLALSLLGRKIQAVARERMAGVLPLFMVLLAVLFILRGLNLGIPYVSPHVKTSHASTFPDPICSPSR
jgi:sulfite exporter TauE/SafE